MAYNEIYYSPTPQEHLVDPRLRGEFVDDIGHLAVTSLSIGIVDTPQRAPYAEVAAPAPETEQNAEVVNEYDTQLLRTMGGTAALRMHLDETVAYNGYAAQN